MSDLAQRLRDLALMADGAPRDLTPAMWAEIAAQVRRAATALDKAASPWMTTEEAAIYARCSPRVLEVARGKGGGPPYYRQGARCVVYRREDLDAWRSKGRATHTGAERLAGVPLAN